MKKKKINKIVNDLVLSIKYSRLLAESSDNETNEKDVVKISKKIDEIQFENKPSSYLLLENDKFLERLKLLEKLQYFDLIKFSIATEVLMDNEFKYTDKTNIFFIEKISLLLFDNKKYMFKIKKKFNSIESYIYEDKAYDLMAKALLPIGALIKNNKVAKYFNDVIRLPDKLTVGVKFGQSIVMFVPNYFKHRNNSKRINSMEPGQLGYKLVFNILNLTYAYNLLKDKIEYDKYFKEILKEVNLERKYVFKKLYEEQYEVDKNKKRAKYIQNFDNYVMSKLISDKV